MLPLEDIVGVLQNHLEDSFQRGPELFFNVVLHVYRFIIFKSVLGVLCLLVVLHLLCPGEDDIGNPVSHV